MRPAGFEPALHQANYAWRSTRNSNESDSTVNQMLTTCAIHYYSITIELKSRVFYDLTNFALLFTLSDMLSPMFPDYMMALTKIPLNPK